MNSLDGLVNKALKNSGILKLKLKLEDIHNLLAARYNLTAKIINRFTLILMILASALFLLLVVKTRHIGEKFAKIEKYQLLTYFFNYNLSTLRSDSEETRMIANLLDHGQYNEANVLLAKMYQNDPTKSGALFYLAYANMCNENYKEAEGQFQVLQQTDPLFAGSAEYYLAGCYLLGDKPHKAQRMLKQIVNKGGHYVTKAKSLLYYIKHTE